VIPAAHLPEIHDDRPAPGRSALLPRADERRAAVAAIGAELAGVRFVRLGSGADDVDELVQVTQELAMRR
jgi:hypothetical protein